MAAKPMTVRGLNSAQYITQFLANIDSVVDGVALHAREYPKGKNTTTQDVIDHLAVSWQNRPARDIRPNEDEVWEAAQLLVKEYVRRINRTKGRAEGQNKATVAANAKKEATAAASHGFRKAGKHLQRQMVKRVESGTLTSGGSAEQVDQEVYAPRRQREFGVPTNVVFKRTGLLLANLTSGVLKLHRKGT